MIEKPYDSLNSHSWLALYYDQINKLVGFDAMTVDGQWTVLRERVLAAYPPNDKGRRAAIDAVDKSLRKAILARLAQRA